MKSSPIKRSTKLLAGAILMVMAIVLTHYIALYAMVKSGRYSEISEIKNSDVFKAYYPKPAHTVVLNSLEDVSIVMSDTFYYEVRNEESGAFRALEMPDTLVLRGDTAEESMEEPGVFSTSRFENSVVLHLTGNEHIVSDTCGINISCTLRPTIVDMTLIASQLKFYDYDDSTMILKKVDQLKVNAYHSSGIDFNAPVLVNNMFVRLFGDSHFNDNNLVSEDYQATDEQEPMPKLNTNITTVKNAVIEYSDSATISLSGANLKSIRLVPQKSTAL